MALLAQALKYAPLIAAVPGLAYDVYRMSKGQGARRPRMMIPKPRVAGALSHFMNSPVNSRFYNYAEGGGARRRPKRGGAHPVAHMVRGHMSQSKYGVPFQVKPHLAAGARKRSVRRRGGAPQHYVKPHMSQSVYGRPEHVRGYYTSSPVGLGARRRRAPSRKVMGGAAMSPYYM